MSSASTLLNAATQTPTFRPSVNTSILASVLIIDWRTACSTSAHRNRSPIHLSNWSASFFKFSSSATSV